MLPFSQRPLSASCNTFLAFLASVSFSPLVVCLFFSGLLTPERQLAAELASKGRQCYRAKRRRKTAVRSCKQAPVLWNLHD